MAEKKSKPSKVGEVIEVEDGSTVTRPDGEAVTVSGGFYVLSQPGTYQVGNEELEAK